MIEVQIGVPRPKFTGSKRVLQEQCLSVLPEAQPKNSSIHNKIRFPSGIMGKGTHLDHFLHPIFFLRNFAPIH